MKQTIKKTLPFSIYQPILKWWRKPQPKEITWGNLRRLKPISNVFGLDRGNAIDRYYIESFLARQALNIQGNVLEIADNTYTIKFGSDRVTKSDILHATEGNPQATIIADLTNASNIPSDTFDCIICTQTLPFIYEIKATLQTLHRILKPGGVLLATIPGISQISRYDMDRWGDYWRFTSLSAKKLFQEFFLDKKIEVETYGNVLSAISFLQGISTEELKKEELDYCDPDYEVIITVRAIK
jgi:SAM-dependent methyltransferase